jgi:hypothetical protein
LVVVVVAEREHLMMAGAREMAFPHIRPRRILRVQQLGKILRLDLALPVRPAGGKAELDWAMLHIALRITVQQRRRTPLFPDLTPLFLGQVGVGVGVVL